MPYRMTIIGYGYAHDQSHIYVTTNRLTLITSTNSLMMLARHAACLSVAKHLKERLMSG